MRDNLNIKAYYLAQSGPGSHPMTTTSQQQHHQPQQQQLQQKAVSAQQNINFSAIKNA